MKHAQHSAFFFLTSKKDGVLSKVAYRGGQVIHSEYTYSIGGREIGHIWQKVAKYSGSLR